MNIRPLALSLAIFAVPIAAKAAPCGIPKDGFQVRNGFDGGKKEGQGAKLSVVAPAGESSYSVADVAIKATLCNWGDGAVRLAPWVEYHNDTNPTKPVENYSVGSTLETEPKALKFDYDDGSNAYQTFIDYSLTYKDDIEGEKQSGKLAVLIYGEAVQPIGNLVDNPLAWLGAYSRHSPKKVTIKDHEFNLESDRWRLTPYFGVEQYVDKPEIVAGVASGTETVDPAYFLFRYYAEYWPFKHPAGKGIQIVATYTFRNSLNSEGLDHPEFGTAGINYVFDADEHFSLGVDYSVGDNPDTDFLHEEKTTISLKVKY